MRVDFDVNPHASVSLLNEIGDRGVNMRPAMTLIRDLMAEGHRRNFQSRGAFLGEPWPNLAPSTVERKARQGLPAEPMVATGTLMRAVMGGRGKFTSATRTRAAVGVNRDIFWTIFHLRGSKSSRAGDIPARPVIGMNDGQREMSLTIMQRYLEHGVG